MSCKYLKESFSTIPINPVSLASHLTTSETNKFQRMLEQKANLRRIHLPTHIRSQTNQLKESCNNRHFIIYSSFCHNPEVKQIKF